MGDDERRPLIEIPTHSEEPVKVAFDKPMRRRPEAEEINGTLYWIWEFSDDHES